MKTGDKMDSDGSNIRFPDFLASIAHDMKNSLGMLINTSEEIIGTCSAETCPSHTLLSKLQYEAKRVNNNLIQLLALYKMDKAVHTLNIEYHSLSEFLEDTIAQNRPLLEFRGITIESECPEDLAWFFDRDLISGVVNNVLNNAYRYARDRIQVTATEDDGYLALHIKDNGEGYPQHMITEGSVHKQVNFSTGSTGLGIYFASVVASMHRNRNRSGFIRTSNCEISGGGCFSIYLP